MRVLRVRQTFARGSSGGEILRVHPGTETYALQCAGISIHCAWGARCDLQLDRRALALDDDVFLVAAPERRIRVQFRGGATGRALAICYSRGAAMRLLAELPPWRCAGAVNLRELGGDPYFSEHIRMRDRSSELLLRFIARHVDEGLDDALWYEEQSLFLLRRLLLRELGGRGDRVRAPLARTPMRRALVQRLGNITDLIHTAYERRLTLADFAAAANLSTFHMLRSFKLLHGMTPYEFLQRRRLSAGMRLLCSTNDSIEQIAECVGFADRRSFHRLAVREFGMHLRGLRRQGVSCL